MSNPSEKRFTDRNGNQAMGWYGWVVAYAVVKVRWIEILHKQITTVLL